MRHCTIWAIRFLCLLLFPAVASAHPLLSAMQDELTRSFSRLSEVGDSRLYFMAYAAVERNHKLGFTFSQGALVREDVPSRSRRADVEIRLGSRPFDNTHYFRERSGSVRFPHLHSFNVPIDDDSAAIRAALWRSTDQAFKDAVEKFRDLQTNVSVKVKEQDTSDDFSKETPVEFAQPAEPFEPDRDRLKTTARDLSRLFLPHPWIYFSQVSISADDNAGYFVSTEGTRLTLSDPMLTLNITAKTLAPDGMELLLYKNYYLRTEKELPPAETLQKETADLIRNLSDLREAPIVEPYSGPAIISGRAAAVFFHEILGHRLEGHRNRVVEEGQTFVQKLGQRILPEFMSLVDDPTLADFRGQPLNGHYRYDDEGVAAQKVSLIENGVLKNFLMCRKPVRSFPSSNGHGRRSLGRIAVARQGTLMVESRQTVPPDRLREMLIEECKKQEKPYGYIFLDIEGGFTFTGRSFPQAFKVLPLLVKRVYTDGRPDEWVRGVDIVGTPLTSLEQILAVGDDPVVFNGICGAESGSVPVSAVSGSILVKSIEIEKARHEQDRPPILPAPDANE